MTLAAGLRSLAFAFLFWAHVRAATFAADRSDLWLRRAKDLRDRAERFDD